jgi:hypothetical protein
MFNFRNYLVETHMRWDYNIPSVNIRGMEYVSYSQHIHAWNTLKYYAVFRDTNIPRPNTDAICVFF